MCDEHNIDIEMKIQFANFFCSFDKYLRMVLVADDENRENEGDLIVAAAHATADNVNFMAGVRLIFAGHYCWHSFKSVSPPPGRRGPRRR